MSRTDTAVRVISASPDGSCAAGPGSRARIRDLGDHVAVLLRVRGNAPHRDRNDKIVRIDRSTGLDDALEAAGLSE
jgi:hypothetical protein